MRKLIVIVLALVMAAALVPSRDVIAEGPHQTSPDVIELPNGFQPEGIVTGRGTSIYAGSLVAGAIYKADLRTGEGALLVPQQEGRVAVGLGFDRRTNYVYVSGGPTGQAFVYDGATGAEVGVFQLTTESETFVNDVIVTQRAAYFTDSFQPVLYRLPLLPGGRLPEPSEVETIPLGGDFQFVSDPGAFNTNGIEATSDGKFLVIVNSAVGALYRVNPRNGEAKLIDLGGASMPNGDGLLLKGHRLFVVQNFLNQIAVVRLNDRLTSGEVRKTISNPSFDIPTTIASFGASLYVVNSRFSTPPTPDTEYTIVKVDRDPDDD
ncbi:MAG TPA: superoxide dismutase [Anaerolineae bacterium]|nr:superoxide dismutase [Anaerolineae bacterium]